MLGRIFKRKKTPAVAAPTLATGMPCEVLAANFQLSGELAAETAQIDFKFMSLILGAGAPDGAELSPAENEELERFRFISQQQNLSDKLIPRLPSVMPKILSAIRNDNSTTQDLADIISGDVSLLGEVIRISNSPFYQTSVKITSLKQAIVQLGTRGIKQLVSGATLKPILNARSAHSGGFAINHLWNKNQKAAMAGSYLANQTGEDPFHAYLAGLLSQAGLLILMKQINPEFWNGQRQYSHRFITDLNEISKQASVALSIFWEMPEAVTNALQEQSSTTDNPASMMGSISHVAAVLANLSLLISNSKMPPRESRIKCQFNGAASPLCEESYRLINLEETMES